MRIVIDAYWWSRGTQSLRHVVRGLVECWARAHPEDELVIVVHGEHLPETASLPSNVRAVGTRLWPHALSAMFVVPWVARRAKADAVLSQNFAPLFGQRRSVFVQDVMFATNPEWFTRKELLYYRWMLRTARRADVVFSSTDTEGERLRQHTRAKRVVTAGLGLSPELIDSQGSEPDLGLRPNGFVLAVGRLNVRKNLVTVLEGAHASGVMTPECPLVIVGERDGQWSELPAWVPDAVEAGSVVFTGFVSTGDLRWLIGNTLVYVCLSLDEGFGLPPVEARVIGARVLVSDIPVFRETLDSSATFVDPLDVGAVAQALRELAARPVALQPSAELRSRHSWSPVVDVMRSVLSAPPKQGGAR